VRSGKLSRIGKEEVRLDQDEGASLEAEQPVEYEHDDLLEDIAYLTTFPEADSARSRPGGAGLARSDKGTL
jgi:hypothetical protein